MSEEQNIKSTDKAENVELSQPEIKKEVKTEKAPEQKTIAKEEKPVLKYSQQDVDNITKSVRDNQEKLWSKKLEETIANKEKEFNETKIKTEESAKALDTKIKALKILNPEIDDEELEMWVEFANKKATPEKPFEKVFSELTSKYLKNQENNSSRGSLFDFSSSKKNDEEDKRERAKKWIEQYAKPNNTL